MDVCLIQGDELLEKCNSIWNKVSNTIEKEIDWELLIYNKIFLKTKIRSDDDQATDFFDKDIPNQALIILVQQ